jgi:hypothetical protein
MGKPDFVARNPPNNLAASRIVPAVSVASMAEKVQERVRGHSRDNRLAGMANNS